MNKPLSYTDVMKPADINIADLWANFAGHVLPADAGATQRSEMRKAFYAGFCECFKIVTDLSSELGEKDAVAVLDRLNREAHAFYKAMLVEHPIR